MNPAPMPLISALYTGVFALLLVALALLVSRRRRSHGHRSRGRRRRPAGAGDSRARQRGRVGTARFCCCCLIAEENRASPLLLHLCGVVFILARVMHAAGLVAGQWDTRSAGSPASR